MKNGIGYFLKVILYLLVAVMGAAVFVYDAWCTIIAFVGGTIPFIGIKLGGGLFSGLLWLFILDPIVITAIYWIVLAVITPLAAIVSAFNDE